MPAQATAHVKPKRHDSVRAEKKADEKSNPLPRAVAAVEDDRAPSLPRNAHTDRRVRPSPAQRRVTAKMSVSNRIKPMYK